MVFRFTLLICLLISQAAALPPDLRENCLAPSSDLFPDTHFLGTPKEDFPLSKSAKLILDSLGTTPAGALPQTILLKKLLSEETVQSLPFEINSQGLAFFRELLPIQVELAPQAHLIVYSNEKGIPDSFYPHQKTGPFGVMVFDPSRTFAFFFDMTELFYKKKEEDLGLRFQPWNERILWALQKEWLPKSTALLHLNLIRRRFHILDKPYEILVMDGAIFNPNDIYSRDFQTALLEYRDEIKGKRVAEIGVGTGINLIHLLRAGAAKVAGNDISMAHVLLARWNLQFAADTGMIPQSRVRDASVNWGNGWEGIPEADWYLFNAPSIRSDSEMMEKRTLDEIRKNSICIPVQLFRDLMSQLKGRLHRPATRALWRILPTEQSGLSRVSQEELALKMKKYSFRWPRKDISWAEAAAESLIVEYGLEGALQEAHFNHYGGIFLIESQASPSLDNSL